MGNPLHETITVFYRDNQDSGTNQREEKKDDRDKEEESTNKQSPTLLRFTSNDLVHMDEKTNSYIYVNGKNGYRLSLTRVISLPRTKLNLDMLARSKWRNLMRALKRCWKQWVITPSMVKRIMMMMNIKNIRN